MAPNHDLHEKLGIVFEDLDFNNPHRPSTAHGPLLQRVWSTGRTRFEEWQARQSDGDNQAPWRKLLKARAGIIASKAAHCVKTLQNESEWRLKLEPLIFARFESELICKSCRTELWRSTKDISELRSLPKGYCKCDEAEEDDQWDEVGVSKIFDSHAEEYIQHSVDIAKLRGRAEKPDRIIGLRKTKRFTRLLARKGDDKKIIGTTIRSCPFRKRRAELIFPFLVLEAKSEKAGSSGTAVQRQIACSIVTLLQIQQELAESAKQPDDTLEPLVWFLSHQVSNLNWSRWMYHVFSLWHGSITQREQALQLLLLVDEIFDWARDSYRSDLIKQLVSMGPRPSASVIDETEIGSLAGDWPRFQTRVPPSNRPAQPSTTSSADPTEQRQNMLRFFDYEDTHYGAIRNASWTEHSLCAIEINLENVDFFLYSLGNDQKEVSRWARMLQTCLKPAHAWRLSLAALNQLELEWTDRDRDLVVGQHLDETFVVSFALTSGISYPNVLSRALSKDGSEWNIFHSLTFVAVSEDALNLIVERAGSGWVWAQDLRAAPCYDAETAAGFFARMRLAPARQSLAAAIYSTRRMTSNYSDLRNSSVMPEEEGRSSAPSSEPVWISPVKETNSIGLPHFVRRQLVPGGAEPDFPFLRCSFQKGSQPHHGSELLDWPDRKNRICKETHAVFISTKVPRGPKSIEAHCIFVLDVESIPHEVERTSQSLSSVQHVEIDINETSGGLQSRPRPKIVTPDATKLGARLKDFNKLLRTITSIYLWRNAPQSLDEMLQSDAPFSYQVYAGHHRGTWGLPVQKSILVIRKAWTEYKMDRVMEFLNAVVLPNVAWIRTDFGDGVPPVGGEEKSRKRPYAAVDGEDGAQNS